VELARELLRAERQTAVKLRNEGGFNDEVLRRVEHELDWTKSGFTDVSADSVEECWIMVEPMGFESPPVWK